MKSLFVALFVCICTCSGAAAESGNPASGAEVQINLCSEPQQIITALQLKHQGGKSREAWYFDTAGLDLFKKGVLLRLRLSGQKSELTLKVAHQHCAAINPVLLPANQAKCEHDMHGEQLEGAVSISRMLEKKQVRGLFKGKMALADLLSPAQIRYLQEGIAVWPLPLGLKRLGPAHIDTYRKKGQPFVVEIWQLPSGLRTAEISQKSNLAEVRRVESDLKELLNRNQVKVCEDQGSQAGRKLNEYLKGL